MSERMSLEDEILEEVVDEFCRRVVVALYLVADDFYLLVYLLLRITAVKDYIREEINSLGRVFLKYGRVIDGIFLVGKGIEFTANSLKTVDDMPCPAVFCPLECGMFAEMSHTLLAL